MAVNENKSSPGKTGRTDSDIKAYRLGYRSDIEGLRAVAILLVVAHHAGLSWFGGGYIGVDVFFVISGYLITGLLLQEIRSTGRIRLLEFYARRLRRLLPALILMIVCVVVASAILLAPLEQPFQAITAATASVWASNILFAFSDVDYFAPTADTSLFLHTWSLGVEEQFYLVWPLLLMFLLGAWRWQGGAQNHKRLVSGLFVTVGLCLLLSVFLTYTSPMMAFYLTPSRAWQFALGALAWLWSNNSDSDASGVKIGFTRRIRAHEAGVLGWVGIALVLASAAFLDTKIAFPGLWALAPSVGTALILTAGAVATTGVARLLSVSPMQAVGRLSYSWYLWHWPFLVLGATLFVDESVAQRTALVGVSLAAAAFSYFVVESPIRRNRIFAKRPRLTLAAASMLMVFAVGGSIVWQSIANTWAILPTQIAYQKVRLDVPAIYPMGCDQWFSSSQVVVCTFGQKEAEKTAVLIGDSIMGQWFPAVAQTYIKPGWRLLVMTKSSCPMVDEPYFYERIGMEYTVCSRWRKQALLELRSIKPDVLIMGGASTYDFSEDQWVSGTRRVLENAAPAAGNVFIILGTHHLPFDGPSCLARRAWRPTTLAGTSDCSAQGGSERESNVKAWIGKAVEGFHNVKVVDPNPILCPDGRCYAERDGNIVFRDNQHVAAAYTRVLGKELARRFGILEGRSETSLISRTPR